MPFLSERVIKRNLPISLTLFFIILISLIVTYRYSPYHGGPDINRPPPKKSPPSYYDPPQYNLSNARPKEKKYTSPALEKFLKSVSSSMKDRDLYVLLQNCLPNTLDTTLEWFNGNKQDPRTFLVTGDIPAMWIRDSTNQIKPYLRFIDEDSELRDLVFGVIQVQASYLNYDPYANAFLRPWYAPKKHGERGSTSDRVIPAYDPEIVWESKYELDSLGHFLQLTNDYIETSGDVERVITSKDWLQAMPRIFRVLHDQMQDTWPAYNNIFSSKPVPYSVSGNDPEPVPIGQGYRFRRQTDRPTETLGEYGIGGVTRKCGLIRSAFRPSDDATTFPYLIPSNAQISVQLIKLGSHIELFLNKLKEEREKDDGSNHEDNDEDEDEDEDGGYILANNYRIHDIATAAIELGKKVRKAIYEHAVVTHPVFGQVFAFEVDCYGSQNIMDDANTPSLLGLPVLGFVDKNDPIYLNTRNLVLSNWNPWFFNGSFAKGIGGPHTGQNMIWPMSILTQIQTSTSEEEVIELIDIIKRTAKQTGNLMVESFNANRPSVFTRPWFSWANGLAGSTILQILDEYPHLA